MESLIFNEANETDIPILSDILRDATERKVGYGDNVWGSDGWTDEEISDAMDKSTMYIVRKDDDIVGTISVQMEDEQMWGQQPEDAVYLHRLAVTGNYHGQGLGEAMIAWAATQATKEGRRVLRLDCEESNTQLRAYYEKLGFIQVGRKYIPEWNYWGALYEKTIETGEDEA
jgi:ribosomal protein S18 acetylase RimI-like enzyme